MIAMEADKPKIVHSPVESQKIRVLFGPHQLSGTTNE